NVVTPDEKTRQTPRNRVNARFELRCGKPHPVSKDTALRVVAGLNQLKFFACGQDFIAPRDKSLEIGLRDESCPWFPLNQLGNGMVAIANNSGKNLFGDGKNASACLVREAIIENPNFVRAWDVALDNQRG